MAARKNPVKPPSWYKVGKHQEPLIPPVDRLKATQMKKQGQNGGSTYKKEYDDLVIKLLGKSAEAKCRVHLCQALRCSLTTIADWEKKYPSFAKAVSVGMEMGQAKFRDKISKHAFKPGKDVNNGLIKLLANNVYGIKEEHEPVVVVNNSLSVNPEKELKNRGIPIPDVGIEDVEEDEDWF